MELPLDLYPEYCEYCGTLCIIYCQIEIVKISEETSPKDFSLRGKLLMGISENFNKAYLLTNSELMKLGGNDSFRNYLNNRSFYYKSLVYKKISESHLDIFDKKGTGYGEALIYLQLSIQQLKECQKTMDSCEGLVDIESFNNALNNDEKLEAKMADLNYRIYHQYTPDPNKIKIETKIMVQPLAIDNLYIGENKINFRENNDIYCEDLDLLTPNEIKPMLDNYKNQLTNFLNQYLNKYQDE